VKTVDKMRRTRTIPTPAESEAHLSREIYFVKFSLSLAGDVTPQFRSAGLPSSQFATLNTFADNGRRR
jgi:hypothetical protein